MNSMTDTVCTQQGALSLEEAFMVESSEGGDTVFWIPKPYVGVDDDEGRQLLADLLGALHELPDLRGAIILAHGGVELLREEHVAYGPLRMLGSTQLELFADKHALHARAMTVPFDGCQAIGPMGIALRLDRAQKVITL